MKRMEPRTLPCGLSISIDDRGYLILVGDWGSDLGTPVSEDRIPPVASENIQQRYAKLGIETSRRNLLALSEFFKDAAQQIGFREEGEEG